MDWLKIFNVVKCDLIFFLFYGKKQFDGISIWSGNQSQTFQKILNLFQKTSARRKTYHFTFLVLVYIRCKQLQTFFEMGAPPRPYVSTVASSA